jgi:hypothetical protein
MQKGAVQIEEGKEEGREGKEGQSGQEYRALEEMRTN